MARGDGAAAMKTDDTDPTDQAPRLNAHQQRHLERKRLQAEMVHALVGCSHLACLTCHSPIAPRLRRAEPPPPCRRWPFAVLRAR